MPPHHPLKFKGDPLTLSGKEVKVGDRLPDFVVTGTDMADVTLKHFKDRNLVLCSVPSLDTPVCSAETKHFAAELRKIPGTAFLTVSLDLPFAQKRWCVAEEVESAFTASDYKYRQFGEAFGVTIVEWGLLSRAVFIADKKGTVAHVEYVPEVSSEPNYEEALNALKKLG